MISLCWGCELHQGTETTEVPDDSQRGRSISIEEQPCPTWYRETKYSGVTRCVCGATLEDHIVCNYTTQKTLIFPGYCMSYNDTTKDTVAGGCPFSNHDGAHIFYVTLPNDTSELKHLHMQWFEPNWPSVQSLSKRFGTFCSLLHMAVCRML